MLLYHAFGFDSSTLDLWLLIGFVEVVGCREALIFVLIWLCFADIVLSAEHILIFSLKGLMFVNYRRESIVLCCVSVLLVLFKGRLSQKFV